MDKIVDNLAICVLGLGEAGSAIAADLVAAGAQVRAWDPLDVEVPAGIERAADAASASARCAVVLSVNRAAVAVAVAEEVAPALAREAVFADLNTAAPGRKREVAAVVEPTGASFADVALLLPVPGRGIGTPAFVSGSGAARYLELLGPLGLRAERLGEVPGEAAERKLLRSVFGKGMAIAVVEAMAAAKAAGCADWMREQLVAALEDADEAMLDRWLLGSVVHAERRVDEMAASAELLDGLGTPPRVATAAREWFEQLAEERG